MENRLAKVALLFVLFGTIVWLGGINVRAAAGFSLLQMGTLDFEPNIHPYTERAIFSLVSQSSMVIGIAYLVTWCSGMVFLRSTHLRLRENGWLMMSAILLYLFTPVEIYALILDAQMWYLDHIGSNDLVEFRKLFIHRLAALSGVPIIALLSYYTALGLIVFRPLQRPRIINPSQTN